MDRKTRSRFLRLLDRDLTLLVYCSACDNLHTPYTLTWRSCCRMETDGLDRKHHGSPKSNYSLANFHFIHAVMRSYRRACGAEAGAAAPLGRRIQGDSWVELLPYSETAGFRRPIEQMLGRGAVVYRQMVVAASAASAHVGGLQAQGQLEGQQQQQPPRGSFISMRQSVFPIVPASRGRVGSINTLRNLYEIGCYVRWSSRICNHRRWNTEYPWLLPDLGSSSISPSLLKPI